MYSERSYINLKTHIHFNIYNRLWCKTWYSWIPPRIFFLYTWWVSVLKFLHSTWSDYKGILEVSKEQTSNILTKRRIASILAKFPNSYQLQCKRKKTVRTNCQGNINIHIDIMGIIIIEIEIYLKKKKNWSKSYGKFLIKSFSSFFNLQFLWLKWVRVQLFTVQKTKPINLKAS